MAYADYRHCDVCDGKCFYDTDLGYEFHESEWVEFDEVDKARGYKLGYLGNWGVICKECMKDWEVVIQKKTNPE